MSIRKIEAYLLNKKIVLLSVAIDTGSHNLEKNEKVLQNNKFNFKDMEFNCTTWNDTNLSTTSYIECSNNLFNTKATISSYRRFAFSGVLHIK